MAPMLESLFAAVVLAASPLPSAYTAPAVAAGEKAPDPSVLQKITELADDALRRAGVPESGLAPDPG